MADTMKIKNSLLALFLLISGLFIMPSYALAATAENEEQKRNICGGANLSLSKGGDRADGFNRSCDKQPKDGTGDPSNDIERLVQTIVDILSVVVGIVAVFMIIIGGFRFITSGGDSARVTSAKNAIMYAIVGLIVVALAQFIVRFILSKTPS
jgi:hypothetical protein